MNTLSTRFKDLQAKLAALKEAQANKPKPRLLSTLNQESTQSTTILTSIPNNPITSTGTDRHGNTITYNPAQQQAIDLITSGQSCVVIGAAGTGKTTIQKASTAGLLQSGKILPQLNQGHKYLSAKSPGIAIVAYTRRATNNIRKNMSEDLQPCCITIHKLLEYAPAEVFITDPETGKEKRSMRSNLS